MRPGHRAVAIPPPECSTASVSCGGPYCLRSTTESSASGAWLFGVTCAFTFVTAQSLAHHPKDGFVDRLHSLRFLHECDPSYRGLTFPLVGLFPLTTSPFFWTYGRRARLPRCLPRRSRTSCRAIQRRTPEA